MKQTFLNSPRPLLVGSIRVKNTAEGIADIKASEMDGARAFILHIQMMEKPFAQPEELRRIFAATKCPVMAINYPQHNDIMDDSHIQGLYEAVEAGSACVDIRADAFDLNPQSSLKECRMPFAMANPMQVSMRPECIDRQKACIEKIHAMGAEALLSAHVFTSFNCEQAVSLALEMESRGADIVKIVTGCPDVDHVLEMLRTTVKLKKRLKAPFLYICTGPHGSIIRPLSPLFGSMLVFGHHNYNEMSNKLKPLLGNLREFYRIVPWRIEDYME